MGPAECRTPPCQGLRDLVLPHGPVRQTSRRLGSHHPLSEVSCPSLPSCSSCESSQCRSRIDDVSAEPGRRVGQPEGQAHQLGEVDDRYRPAPALARLEVELAEWAGRDDPASAGLASPVEEPAHQARHHVASTHRQPGATALGRLAPLDRLGPEGGQQLVQRRRMLGRRTGRPRSAARAGSRSRRRAGARRGVGVRPPRPGPARLRAR